MMDLIPTEYASVCNHCHEWPSRFLVKYGQEYTLCSTAISFSVTEAALDGVEFSIAGVSDVIDIIGRPSVVKELAVKQTADYWMLHWENWDYAMPTEYLAELSCGVSNMTVIYNESSSLEKWYFHGMLDAKWMPALVPKQVHLSSPFS